MRVLLTGAGGNLGRAAVPALTAAGHRVRLFDFRPLPDADQGHLAEDRAEDADGHGLGGTVEDMVVGDVRDQEAVARAVEGVDVVVHGAALHGVHLDSWPAPEFWSTNATGTFTVYEAARAAGVRRVVLASSMVVYGSVGGEGGSWGVVDEQSPPAPADLYGLTKVVAEQVARSYADLHGISTISLRLGMFVPESFERYGFRLLFGGVDDRDVGQAVASALRAEPEERFTAVDIMADPGLSAADVPRLETDLPGLLEERWPGTLELVREHGLDLDELVWGRLLFPVHRARAVLGYSPRYDFAAFLDAWRRGDRGHYPFADEPWWGAQRPA